MCQRFQPAAVRYDRPTRMIESELHPPDAAEPDHGPPVLLKRLGSAVEANLARNKLATAGIPAFLAGENTFAGDVMHPLPYREVELYVPQSLATEALDVLDAPPSDPAELFGDPFIEDPARRMSFRAFVAGVVGWCLLVLAVGGPFFAIASFVYAIFLSLRAMSVSTDRAPATVVKCGAALLFSVVGLVVAIGVLIMLSR